MQQAVRWIRRDGQVVDCSSPETLNQPGRVRLLDQTRLPGEVVFLEIDELEPLIDAIRRLAVRGAPAIGCAAALGLAAVAGTYPPLELADFRKRLEADGTFLAAARPTAVNLSWAVHRVIRETNESGARNDAEAKRFLLHAALTVLAEDIQLCRSIGESGLPLLRDGMTVLTHCNAGALATADYGTALAPIYLAHEAGRSIRVYADETRPLLQGARLTAWELQQAGVEVCVICDNMAGLVMKEKRIDLVIVGADRIAANGDTANKIGTYSVAVLAAWHRIPFYVAAPYSTFDLSLPDGTGIPIEERDGGEIGNGFGRRTAPEGVAFYNPAFDVTPHELITGYITERGILTPPFSVSGGVS